MSEQPATDLLPPNKPEPKLSCVDRQQIIPAMPLENLLDTDHQARIVWDFVRGIDLSPLYAPIRSFVGGPGRPAIDPRILVSLWLYAALEGVGSARALDYLCEHHNAFRWLAGGVSVNYHTLADFRVDHLEFLDGLLTHSVAVLREQDLVDLNRVAHDGMRVRASAGAASFRRRPTLQECLTEAQEQVQRLKEELEDDPGAGQRRQAKAQERAAREREQRVRAALERLPELEAKKKPDEKDKARASTTDAEATVMKMGDGGFRPAYNVQFATDTASQIIVGVDVSTAGSDQGQMPPMVEQIEERFAVCPEEYLVDGGFAKHEDIAKVSQPKSNDASLASADGGASGACAASASGGSVGAERTGAANAVQRCTVYAPVPKPKDAKRDRYAPVAGDSQAVAEWRARMGSNEAKEIYKDRAATAECVNAQARNRGLLRLTVRGRLKAKAIALWYAVAHNLLRAVSLRAALAAQG
jgi:transposase